MPVEQKTEMEEEKMDFDELEKQISDSSKPRYWCFIAENDKNCCERCLSLDGKVFSDDDPAMPELPLHPNCRCSWREATASESDDAMEIITPQAPSFAGIHWSEVVEKVKNIYAFKIPKPPRMTNNKANWLNMTWMWFFEQGKNPIYFDCNSPESQDIADSYSMKEVKQTYFKTGKTPTGWSFTGPKTATGYLGEVEWFIGSYSI